MSALCSIQVFFLGLASFAAPAAGDELRIDDARYRIEVPDVVLTDVPVEWVTISALDADGKTDESFNGRPLIEGITLIVKGRDTALPRFENGVLELTTDLAVGRKVYITDSTIVVDPDSRRRAERFVWRTLRWFSLVPPVLAILLAVWLRNVIIALFVGVWSGVVILYHGDLATAFVRTLDTFLINELIQSDSPGHSHMLIVLFTMLLGATVGVMTGGGGTAALVSSLARFTQKREHAQLMTWALGLVIFFDDYANTLMVGSTMRPVTDRLKISREKLAFLVDSTAAPIAGLAIVSTWVGVEVSYIADTYSRLGLGSDAYSVFLYTIPYRFYPLHLVVFVWLIAYSGRDYGSMLKAETRALKLSQLTRPGAVVPGDTESATAGMSPRRELLRNALVPLSVLLGAIVVGLWWTGTAGLEAANRAARAAGEPEIATSLFSILDNTDPNRVLFLSSFIASLAALTMAVASNALTLPEAMNAWASGAKSMFFALLILVLAWGVATVCDENHLNTAGFLVELSRGSLAVNWMPMLAFVLAAAVSFATGSSWSTMGLLMPLFISVTYYLLVDLNEGHDPNHQLLLATIGGVLAGSIFGDHCSPISDTTVLSSAASACDHIDHVTTQIPYAVSVALVALLFGYVPVGFGYSPLILLPLALLVLFLLVQFLGRSPEDFARQQESVLAEADEAAKDVGGSAELDLSALDD